MSVYLRCLVRDERSLGRLKPRDLGLGTHNTAALECTGNICEKLKTKVQVTTEIQAKRCSANLVERLVQLFKDMKIS
jgi:hypothetical protein